MITKVKTESGDRWAIILKETNSFENVKDYVDGLITILKFVTYHGDMLPSDEICSVLSLLELMMPTTEQVSQYEHFLEKVNNPYICNDSMRQ